MADDPIARLAGVLFEENQLGKACFNIHELEAILRHSQAIGRREMAQQCADALRPVAADSDDLPPRVEPVLMRELGS